MDPWPKAGRIEIRKQAAKSHPARTWCLVLVMEMVEIM
jgi:hypothetical protein